LKKASSGLVFWVHPIKIERIAGGTSLIKLEFAESIEEKIGQPIFYDPEF
jgi:hypothetical protein